MPYRHLKKTGIEFDSLLIGVQKKGAKMASIMLSFISLNLFNPINLFNDFICKSAKKT